MLDDRKAAILQAVVQEYIATAVPVGSGRVADWPGVAISSATVRNEMAALEKQGYLAQPHTSAGRVPTDKGYRFFVDRVRRRTPALDAADRRQVRDFFASAHGEVESMLSHTTELLSTLTQWTGVVVGPSSESATVRSVQLVDLSSHVLLLVAVLSNGVIHKHALEVEDRLTTEALAVASDRLARAVVGRSPGDLDDLGPGDIRPGDTGPDPSDPLVRAAVGALRSASSGHEMFVGGASKLTAAFDAVEPVRAALDLLEQQLAVITLIREVLDRGQRVAIGEETGLMPLLECSLVLAPYEVRGQDAGTIGVLGPTRMDYHQALSVVAVVSRRLGAALSED